VACVTNHQSRFLSFLSFLVTSHPLPRNSDAYHTHYNLSGLSMAQHRVVSSSVRSKQVEDAWIASGMGSYFFLPFYLSSNLTQNHRLMNSANVPLFIFSHGQRRRVVRMFGEARQIDWYAFIDVPSLKLLILVVLKERDSSVDKPHNHPY
jgi:hypothetical protein